MPVVLGAVACAVLVAAQLGLGGVGGVETSVLSVTARAPAAVEDPAPPTGTSAPPSPDSGETILPPPAEPGPEAQLLAETLAAAGDIRFDIGAVQPADGSTEQLDAVAQAIRAAPNSRIGIIGYSDPGGDASVAQDRAESVTLSMRLRMIPADQLVTDVGSIEAAGGSGRVELRVLGP